MVHPTGIEPVSTVPETAILSVELRVQVASAHSVNAATSEVHPSHGIAALQMDSRLIAPRLVGP